MVTLPCSSSSVHRIFNSFAARVIRPKLSKPIGIGASPMTSLRGGGAGSERDSRGFLRPKSSHALLKPVVEKARRWKVEFLASAPMLRPNRCGAKRVLSDCIVPRSRQASCCGFNPLLDAEATVVASIELLESYTILSPTLHYSDTTSHCLLAAQVPSITINQRLFHDMNRTILQRMSSFASFDKNPATIDEVCRWQQACIL